MQRQGDVDVDVDIDVNANAAGCGGGGGGDDRRRSENCRYTCVWKELTSSGFGGCMLASSAWNLIREGIMCRITKQLIKRDPVSQM